jgi:hypothetical protein
MNRVSQLKAVQKEALALFERKNADYGDAFAKYGTVGVLMRMEDKLQRFLNISKTDVRLVENEGVRDTLLDLHNYAAMALMLLDEKDEKEPENIIIDTIVPVIPLCVGATGQVGPNTISAVAGVTGSNEISTTYKDVKIKCEYCKS